LRVLDAVDLLVRAGAAGVVDRAPVGKEAVVDVGLVDRVGASSGGADTRDLLGLCVVGVKRL
jgi:hypothetical protein